MATKSFLTQNPSYPANVSTLASNITSLPLSPARIDWFSHRLSSILSTIHSAFPPVVPSFSQSQPPSPPHLRIGHPHAAPPAPVSPRPPLYDRALSRIHVHPMHVTPQWYKYPWVFDRTSYSSIPLRDRLSPLLLRSRLVRSLTHSFPLFFCLALPSSINL
jgi:hypothetical protein